MDEFPEVKSSFKDYSWLIFGNGALLLLSVAYMSLLTRILGPDGYGILALFLLVVQGLFSFFVNWTSAAVIRYGREEFIQEGKVNKVFWGRSFIIAICLLLACVLVFFWRQEIAAYIGLPFNRLWLLLVTVVVLTLLSFIQYIFQAVRMIRQYSISQALEKLIQVLALCCVFAGLWSKSVTSIIALLALTSFLTLLWCLLSLDRRLFLPLELDLTTIKRILRFSYPIILGSISAYAVNWIDIIVIKKYMTLADVGIYSVAYRGMSMIQQIGMLTNVVLGPLLVSFVVTNRDDLVKRYVQRLIPQAMVAWTGLLILSLFAGQIMVPILFGHKFMACLPPFFILLCGVAFNGLAVFYGPLFTAYEWIKQSMLINIAMALVNLAADLTLVPVLGLKGAAIATTLAMLVSTVLFLVLISKYLQSRQIYPLLVTIPLLLGAGLLLVKPLWWYGLIACLGGLGLLYILARKLSLFAPEDLGIIEKIDMPNWLKDFLSKHIYRR
ncbi:MAG: oligosaccharide flippase family protein [bacterium]|nr:oligosaccharide flippase family protein [bacterium]